jgi:dCMP deaminase
MREPVDWYFLKMALLVAQRGTCARRKVGCILVNEKKHVVATGYNGNPAGQKHCIDQPCKGAMAKSGSDLELCEAIHAEQNALLQCKNVYEINKVYCTVSPCIHCIKLLLNTSAKHIIFSEEYTNQEGKSLWIKTSGLNWTFIDKNIIQRTFH